MILTSDSPERRLTPRGYPERRVPPIPRSLTLQCKVLYFVDIYDDNIEGVKIAG